jgi:uncharacterized oligopeptide transporter (OPT) family protein
VLAYLVLIPIIKFFGDSIPGPLAPGSIPISQMTHNQIRSAYVLYIGAGAVAAGGIISVFRSLPVIWHGLKGGLKDVGKVEAQAGTAVPRTERDLPMKLVLGGSILLVVLIAFANPLYTGGVSILTRIAAAVMIVVFGFLFVTVSSRLTGEIGSSSNPISGMTVATLLLTCLIFLLLGWTGKNYYVTALSLGAIVCIASSNGGTVSQALKTGHLVGATPKAQQWAILIGALGSAVILGPILLALNSSSTVYVPVANDPALAFPADFRVNPSDFDIAGGGLRKETLQGPQGESDKNEYYVWFHTPPEGGDAARYLVNADGVPVYLADPGINGKYKERPGGGGVVTKYDAPKATLMSYIIKGILSRRLPWGLVLLGVMIAIVLEMSGIPSLAFAVGVYLPLASSSPIFIGGGIRWLVDKYIRKKFASHNMTEDQLNAEGDKSAGVLMASGYIAGAALAGIIIAFLTGLPQLGKFNEGIGKWAETNPFYDGDISNILSLIPFVVICVLLYMAGRELILAGKRNGEAGT